MLAPDVVEMFLQAFRVMQDLLWRSPIIRSFKKAENAVGLTDRLHQIPGRLKEIIGPTNALESGGQLEQSLTARRTYPPRLLAAESSSDSLATTASMISSGSLRISAISG